MLEQSILNKSVYGTVETFRKKLLIRDLVERKTFPPKPKYFFWEVNDFCNSRCHYCNIWQREINKNYLSPAEIESIFSQGDFSEVESIIISGGEPILHPEIEECLLVINKFVKEECCFSFSTNGLLADKVFALVTSLAEKGLNITVGISLDGLGEVHDQSRGVPGNFKKVDYLIDKLNEYKQQHQTKYSLQIGVGSMVTPKTVASIKELILYTIEKGVFFLPQMYEAFSYYSSYDKNDPDSELNRDSRFGNMNDENTQTKESYHEFDLIQQENDRKAMLEAIDNLDRKLQYEILYKCINDCPLKFKCASMSRFFMLHHDGTIAPCLKYAHMKIGNIKQDGFKQVWNSEEAYKARKVVAVCRGCSNSWATSWSMQNWLLSFIPLILRSRIRRMFYRSNR